VQLIKSSIIFESGKMIQYKNSLINYSVFGSGKQAVICFHGYGEDGNSYAFLEKYAGAEFTFIAIDLPFHGKTEWKEGLNFSPNDLFEIIKNVQSKEIHRLATSNSRLALMGFSLGGRIALSYYERIPSSIDKIVLLAPDGLKVNFWYWLSTQTWLGNKFFSFTMKRPGWFFGLLRILNKLKLVNASIFKFVNYYIGDREVRQKLYQRWTGLRKLKPHISDIKKLIQKNKTKLRLLYGRHDRIIRSSVADRFRKGIEEETEISIIECGHQVLHEKHVQDILKALRD